MKITVLAGTQMYQDYVRTGAGEAGYRTSMLATDGEDLIEFAGRACYQSWTRPNPETATNAAYLKNILDHEHFSVLEHANVTVYFEEVSRSFTHEFVRHRHLSPSQLSQRFVKIDHTTSPVIPPLFQDDEEAGRILQEAWEYAVYKYDALVLLGETQLQQMPEVNRTLGRKRVREAARAVLPNMTPTAIVMTGNHRAWREFIIKRGAEHVDLEMRLVASRLFQVLYDEAPGIYQDLELIPAADGVGDVVVPRTQ